MGGVHNNQALGHLGIANGKVPGQYTAPVMPNNDGLLLSQAFNQSFDVAQETRYVIAAQVRGNNGISMLGQKRNLVSPRIPELREAMQEHNQWPLTLGYIVHPNAISNDISMLPWFCCGCCHKSLYICIVKNDGALDLFDQIGDRDTTRTGIGAVEDRAAAPNAIALAQDSKPLCSSLVAAVEDEAVGIDNRCRSDPVGVTPYGWTGTRTGATEDAFCTLVIASAFGRTLQTFSSWLIVIVDQVRFDGFILIKERIHVDYQVFDNWKAQHRLNPHSLAHITYEHLTGQAIATIDTHGIRTAHPVRAGAAIGESAVHRPFNGIQRIQQAINGVSLNRIFCPVRFPVPIRVKPFDLHQNTHCIPP